MEGATHIRKLRGRNSPRSFASPEVKSTAFTRPDSEKPARITRRQLGPVLALVQRMAAGGDATTAVDAAALVPVLQRAIVAAPPGRPNALRHYDVKLPDGSVVRAHGLKAAGRAAGKAPSTVANALNKGSGVARFKTSDEYGNPSEIVVRKAKENGAKSQTGDGR